MNINFPADITTLNSKAWYMKYILGMSLDEIGRELGYSRGAVPNVISNAFQKQTRASIYRKQVDYCKNTCKDSTENCYKCHLYNFILKKVIKKEYRKDGMI